VKPAKRRRQWTLSTGVVIHVGDIVDLPGDACRYGMGLPIRLEVTQIRGSRTIDGIEWVVVDGHELGHYDIRVHPRALLVDVTALNPQRGIQENPRPEATQRAATWGADLPHSGLALRLDRLGFHLIVHSCGMDGTCRTCGVENCEPYQRTLDELRAIGSNLPTVTERQTL
jgi:hypothetical protein